MPHLVYALPDGTWRAAAYSILSALKQDPDLRITLLRDAPCPADTLADQLVALAGATQVQALRQVPGEGPLCLVDPQTDFRAPPAKLFDRIAPGQILIHTRGNRAQGLLGACPQDLNHIDTLMPQAITGDDVVAHYANDERRHVYAGRLPQLFPQDITLSRAMAAALPRITLPPTPRLYRIQARAAALRHRLDAQDSRAYLAMLCALSAPNDTGRQIWAKIALDRLPAQPSDHLRKAFQPQRLTTPDWAAYWQITKE